MFRRIQIAILAVAALALAAAPALILGCTQTQRATVTADLQRADIVCVALLADKPASAVSIACHLEVPVAQAIIDGLAAYNDVQSGVSAGSDISGAVAAALDAGAQVKGLVSPADAGAPDAGDR
jgi:hypothetical protein